MLDNMAFGFLIVHDKASIIRLQFDLIRAIQGFQDIVKHDPTEQYRDGQDDCDQEVDMDAISDLEQLESLIGTYARKLNFKAKEESSPSPKMVEDFTLHLYREDPAEKDRER